MEGSLLNYSRSDSVISSINESATRGLKEKFLEGWETSRLGWFILEKSFGYVMFGMVLGARKGVVFI